MKWDWRDKYRYNPIKPNRYMYYRKSYERCFELTNMSCSIYEYEYSGNKIDENLPRVDSYKCELLELEHPDSISSRKSKRKLIDVTLTNYFEHDVKVKGSVRYKLKVERCTYRDAVPDLIVFKSKVRKQSVRSACFIYTRETPDGPMYLNNI